MEKIYLNRLAEATLKNLLDSSGCVLVAGPKFCGKSTLCNRFTKPKISLQTTNQIQLATANPELLLVGDTPHLIDEWQKVPEIWNLIKADLDNNYVFEKYILTGSTTPVNPKAIQHSGAGRIVRMTLKTMSLFESNESKGIFSLSECFKNKDYTITPLFSNENNITLKDIAFLMCRGGWPLSVTAPKNKSLNITKNYYSGLFISKDENDDFYLFLKNKNIELLKVILKEFSRNISTSARKTKIIKEIIDSGLRSTLDEDTFASYEKILKDLFIIYDLPSRNFNIRSSVTARTSPTYHFIDTSIALASMGLNPNSLLNDLNSFGLYFEDFAIRDLSIYADNLGASIKHYRDSSGLEVDLIIELDNGDYCAIEIKIASDKNIQDGKKSLNKFDNFLKQNNKKRPLFKMIVTSHGACYKDNDIYVVPINCLKP